MPPRRGISDARDFRGKSGEGMFRGGVDSAVKLVVGLGNPGRKYEGTRHNIGFMVLAELARRHGQASARQAFDGEVVEAVLAGEKAILLSPWTFMNRSGLSVRKCSDFYKLSPEDVMVICDDLNLPLAKLRLRGSGTAGGQKGLNDVIRHLGTQDVPRLRIGIDRPPEHWDSADYVLSRFGTADRDSVEQAVAMAADAVVVWVREGIAACMNQYN